MPSLRLLLSAILLFPAGCNRGGHTGPVDFDAERALLLMDLRDGVTSQDEIREALGRPNATFQEERIWSYAMLRGKSGLLEARPREHDGKFYLWEHRSYNLVLVFEKGVLKSHTLLR